MIRNISWIAVAVMVAYLLWWLVPAYFHVRRTIRARRSI